MVLADVSTNDTLIICTAISAVPATIAACMGVLNRRSMRVPSGGTIGQKVELTHDLAAASVAHTSAILNGEPKEADTNEGHDA